MFLSLKEDRGFTLTEIMIAFSIFSILILVVYSAFFSQYARINKQMAATQIASDASFMMQDLKEAINDFGSISASNNQLLSSGTVIIDCLDDDVNEGLRFSLDYDQGILYDGQEQMAGENIEAIHVFKGPATYEDVTVVDGVILIVIDMNSRGVTYSLKGGINVEK